MLRKSVNKDAESAAQLFKEFNKFIDTKVSAALQETEFGGLSRERFLFAGVGIVALGMAVYTYYVGMNQTTNPDIAYRLPIIASLASAIAFGSSGILHSAFSNKEKEIREKILESSLSSLSFSSQNSTYQRLISSLNGTDVTVAAMLQMIQNLNTPKQGCSSVLYNPVRVTATKVKEIATAKHFVASR